MRPSHIFLRFKFVACAVGLALTALLLLFNLALAERHAAPEAVTAPTLVSFQGKVTANGSAYNGVGYFKFAVVNAAGTTSYWSNDGTSTVGNEPNAIVPLNVTNGLFTVRLGDTTQGGMSASLGAWVFGAPDRRLRVWFSTTGLTGSFEQLTPDDAIGAVPFALNAETLDGQDASAFAASVHTHNGADIVSGTLPDARLSSNVVMGGQGVSRLIDDAGYLTKTLADASYAATIHTHSGADIVTGTVNDARLSSNVVMGGQGVSRLIDDAGYLTTASAGMAGFITQTQADARYARIAPTTQQIALLKWYTAITGTGSTFSVGAGPFAIAFDGANIWVPNQNANTVSVLRASDGTHVMTSTVGSGPWGIAFDGANMWVTNDISRTVSVLRASDGYHVMTPTVGAQPYSLAFDGANMWITNFGSNTVSVLRASDGFHVMTPTVGLEPVGIAFDGMNMWVANYGSNTVSVLRASDGYHVMTPTVGLWPTAIAFDGMNMWVANSNGNNVSVLSASDFTHVMTPTVGQYPDGLAFDGANMWVANAFSNNVSVLRASDFTHVMTPTVGSYAQALAFDGAFMWVANYSDNTVSKR